jgi:hypothetical protein
VAFAWEAAPNLLLQGLAGLLHLHLRGSHRRALAEGYLQLYSKSRAFPPAAFLALSAGNAALLAAALLKGGGSPWLQYSLRPILVGVVTTEVAVVAGVALAYLRLAARHNWRRAPPDAYELLGAVSSVHRAPGFSVAQEQVELIRFLQGRVERLHGEVLSARPAAAERHRHHSREVSVSKDPVHPCEHIAEGAGARVGQHFHPVQIGCRRHTDRGAAWPVCLVLVESSLLWVCNNS